MIQEPFAEQPTRLHTDTSKCPEFHAQGIYRLGSESREGRELLLRRYAGYTLPQILDRPELFVALMPGIFNAKIDCLKSISPTQGKKVFINLTPGQIKSEHLRACVDKLLAMADKKFSIVLEVTENECIEDWAYTIHTLKQFQQKGVEIAIDDFGAGYANLKSLIQVKPDYVKVDKLILDRACTCLDSENFTYALVSFIHNLGMKAILEGVETERHLAIAIKSRAEFGQGYLFERPQALMYGS